MRQQMRQTAATELSTGSTGSTGNEAELDAACPWHVKGGRGHLCLDCFDRIMAAIPDELARYHALRAEAEATMGQATQAARTAQAKRERHDMATQATSASQANKRPKGREEHETVDVAALVRAELERARRERETRQREAATAARLKRESGMAAFRATIEAIFPPAWQVATRCVFHEPDDRDVRGWVTLTISDVVWRIAPAQFSMDDYLNATTDRRGGLQLKVGDDAHTLRMRLVDETARIIERDEEEAEDTRAVARERDRTRAEWEATCAEIRTEDETCLAEIEAARVAARATAWQWPDGVVLTLYRWEWQKARDEEGNPVMGWGWSTRPTLMALEDADRDVDGRWEDLGAIALEATRQLPGRTINLSYHTHMPVSHTKRFASVAELPHELTEPRSVTVEGIVTRFSDELDEQVYVRRAGATLTLPVDDEPLPWVRAAVEKVRQQREAEHDPAWAPF